MFNANALNIPSFCSMGILETAQQIYKLYSQGKCFDQQKCNNSKNECVSVYILSYVGVV